MPDNSSDGNDGNSAGSKLVLIVDDDSPTRQALSSLLDSQGYHVLQAANGLEALELIHPVTEPPCVVLLDLVMPVMDGWEFLKARAHDWTLSQIPVIVLSANARDGQVMEGVEACLRKPMSFDRLLILLSHLC